MIRVDGQEDPQQKGGTVLSGNVQDAPLPSSLPQTQTLFAMSMSHVYAKAHILTVACDEFSQSKHICVTSTQIKK